MKEAVDIYYIWSSTYWAFDIMYANSDQFDSSSISNISLLTWYKAEARKRWASQKKKKRKKRVRC